MSKFQKSRSFKLNNNSNFNNRISQQFNQSVIQLNKTYSIKENKQTLVKSITESQTESQTEPQIEPQTELQTEPQTEPQTEIIEPQTNSIIVTINSDIAVSFENVHKHNENFTCVNPINNTMKKETIMNFGGKLDYLYNKKLCKNKK